MWVNGGAHKGGPQSLPLQLPGWLPTMIWAGGSRVVSLWVAGLGPAERAASLSGKVTIYSFKTRMWGRNEPGAPLVCSFLNKLRVPQAPTPCPARGPRGPLVLLIEAKGLAVWQLGFQSNKLLCASFPHPPPVTSWASSLNPSYPHLPQMLLSLSYLCTLCSASWDTLSLVLFFFFF